jgi:aminoglycoside 6'-N-acetyltransferase
VANRPRRRAADPLSGPGHPYGPELGFRPLTRADFSPLAEWITAPHVRPWWPDDASRDALEATYGPLVDGTGVGEAFIVEWARTPVGLIQRYRFDDEPDWVAALAETGAPTDAVGIDYLIGDETLTGVGLGPEVISRFVTSTWDQHPDVSAVVVSVQEGNRRSWRALEKAGFDRLWAGELASDDPSDAGISYVYVLVRPIRSSPHRS